MIDLNIKLVIQKEYSNDPIKCSKVFINNKEYPFFKSYILTHNRVFFELRLESMILEIYYDSRFIERSYCLVTCNGKEEMRICYDNELFQIVQT
jgi:hypothetical protein